MFLFKNDVDLFTECGLFKKDINGLCKAGEIILFNQNEDYVEYLKDQEDPIIEKILKNK